MYRRDIDGPLQATELGDLLYVACMVLDEAAVADNTCLILGTTRDRTSYSATIKLNGQTQTVYGASAHDLLAAMTEFIA